MEKQVHVELVKAFDKATEKDRAMIFDLVQRCAKRVEDAAVEPKIYVIYGYQSRVKN